MTPPLEVYRKQLKNRAPEGHQFFFLLLKFPYTLSCTITGRPGATGNHQLVTCHRQVAHAYTKPINRNAPILTKIGNLVNFWA